MKKVLGIVLVLLLAGCHSIVNDYEGVTGDVSVKQISEKKVLDILEDGTGVIIFSFPECPWCQAIMPILNEKANELDTTIYYFNVKEIRNAETDNYKTMYDEIVSYLESIDFDLLAFEKIWVPTIIAVKDGDVVDFHIGTTDDHDKVDNVLPPLTETQTNEVKETLNRIIQKVA
ncbi:hypothetical protein RJG79_00425 [Mycoplasmatota bacterium WC44]